MKTAELPLLNVDAALVEEIEMSLKTGESMAGFILTAIRSEVDRRSNQSQFIRRGLAAIARSEAMGDGIPAETVIAKLESKLAAARERQN